ncbi:MAG: hypothetical protein LBS19_16265 [Clostridiales bacterium]|nr:hypothetical protein [Clostridiales bacterium]
MDEIIPALAGFKGAARRFERKGSFNGIPVVDDYAHHPTEIRASLAAAKHIESAKRVVCVFQPHTRSRTKELFADFTKAFADADKLVFMDIFTPAGREEGHIGISSQDLADALIKNGKDAVVFGSFSDAADYLRKSCRNGDLVITMGAGDVYKVADLLIVTAD